MGYSNLRSDNNKIVETKCVPEQFCTLVKNLSKENKKTTREIGSYGIG